MKLLEETTKAQFDLGQYCRTGKEISIKGVNQERVKHYRRLVYNVVRNTMDQAYPLASQILGEDRWNSLVHDFLINHDCQTPKIWLLPLEFYEYIRDHNYSKSLDLLWLNDLLYFEWIEIEVHVMPDEKMPDAKRKGDLLNDVLVINPEFRLIRLDYPIHQFNIDEAIKKKSNYFVLAARDPDKGHVNFFNLSLLHTWIIENLLQENVSIKSLYPKINQIFGIDSETMLTENLNGFLINLFSKKFILGFKT